MPRTVNLAIIPARGGSKRIPGKNIKPFMGKPMIAYPIEAALSSSLFDRVIVTTDSEEIAKVARAHGAEIPFMREPKLADDHATTDQVLLDTFDRLAVETSPVFACCIYPCTPLVRPEDLQRGLAILKDTGAMVAISVAEAGHPVQRAMKEDANGRLTMIWPEYRLTRSQDLEPGFFDAGQFYWMDVSRYREAGRLYGDDTVPVPLSRRCVVDVDTPEDWQMAEHLYQLQANQQED
jgi:pseudaminic acid cytidylyltransferase